MIVDATLRHAALMEVDVSESMHNIIDKPSDPTVLHNGAGYEFGLRSCCALGVQERSTCVPTTRIFIFLRVASWILLPKPVLL